MMAQTLQLAFRIAFVWAGGFLLAVAVRAMLPDQFGPHVHRQAGHRLPALQPHRILDLPAGRPYRHRAGRLPRHAGRLQRDRACASSASCGLALPMRTHSSYTAALCRTTRFDIGRTSPRTTAQMSDGELLELAEKPEDLTDVAQQVLRDEMKRRALDVPRPENAIKGAGNASRPASHGELGAGTSSLSSAGRGGSD